MFPTVSIYLSYIFFCYYYYRINSHLDCRGPWICPRISRAIAVTAMSPQRISYITITLCINFTTKLSENFLSSSCCLLALKSPAKCFSTHPSLVRKTQHTKNNTRLKWRSSELQEKLKNIQIQKQHLLEPRMEITKVLQRRKDDPIW